MQNSRRRPGGIALWIGVVLAAFCHHARAASIETAPASISETAFQSTSPCPFSAAKGFDQSRLVCGYLDVPENRRDPASSQRLRIPVAIVKSPGNTPKPDPVVFLHGGPGAAPLSAERVYQLFGGHMVGKDRDIIIYNQRGSLMTEPALRCDALLSVRIDAFAADLTLEERDQQISELAKECLRNLMSEGRDLNAYSAQENALDLRDLRQALGIEQWNLMAVSYGTIMSLEAARIDPKGVRSLILDSVVSFESDLFISEGNRNYTYAMSRLLDACKESTPCNSAFPALATTLSALLARLKETPISIEIARDKNGQTSEAIVNWHDFLIVTQWMLYNAETLRLIPLLISETHNGDYDLLTHLIETVYPAPKNQTDSAAGAFFAIVCRDQYTKRERSITSGAYDGYSMAGFLGNVCSDPAFDYAETPPYESFPSTVPTLLLSGYFDPTTPDIYAKEAAKHLPNAIQITIPNFGHSTLSGYTACQTVLAKAFLDDLKETEEFSCVDALPGPNFLLSKAEAMAHFAPD